MQVAFFSIEILETPNSFVKIGPVLELKDVASFINFFFIENDAA